MAFTCTVTAVIPLACTIDGSLSDASLGFYSLGAVLCFSTDFFCLQMAIMPTHDYMVPHTALFFAGTVVYGMAKKRKLEALWYALTVFGTVLFLTLHHWLTAPMTVRDSRRVVVDARVVEGLPELPEASRYLVRTTLSDGWIIALFKATCILCVVLPVMSTAVLMSYSSV
ncbi:hypothetical protein BVRB_1g001620 [Beta vulgaris subsp. vulgaris]|nr:hypothetical protein BVRB_1g001620 [Beta vulgaris subsp. vulgaris]